MLLNPLGTTYGVCSTRKNYVQRPPPQIECCPTLYGCQDPEGDDERWARRAPRYSLFPSRSLALLVLGVFGHSGT